MKRIILIINILFLFQCAGLYAENNPTEYSPQYEPVHPTKLRTLFLGMNFVSGISKDMFKHYDKSSVDLKFAYGFNVSIWYMASKNFGISFEIGYRQIGMKEERDDFPDYMEYDIKYVSFALAPVFIYKGVYFSLGFFLEFPTTAEYDGNNVSINKDLNHYSKPTFGFTLSSGYIFYKSSKAYLFAGIELTAQITNYRVDPDTGGKFFAFFGKIGVLFGIDVTKKKKRKLPPELREDY